VQAACKALPQAKQVKSIGIDMSQSFKNATASCLAQADIVHDRLH